MSVEEMIFPPIRNRALSVDLILISVRLQKEVRERRKDVYTTLSGFSGLPRTFKLGSEIFVTEHKLNEDKKITPMQQKKKGMAPERSAATSKEVEELRKAGILRETRYQTWVANTVMVKRQTEHGECVLTLQTSTKPAQKLLLIARNRLESRLTLLL
ncbi:hypothetical protein Tco_1425842 [Tanacetum coccineum]